MLTYEITEEDKGVISAMAGVPWFQEYDWGVGVENWEDWKDEVIVRATRRGDEVSLTIRKAGFGSVDFYSPEELDKLIRNLEQVHGEAERISQVTKDFKAAKMQQLDCDIEGGLSGVSYEFRPVAGVKYQVVFAIGSTQKSVWIADGESPLGADNMLYAKKISIDTPTTRESALNFLKAYLLRQRGEAEPTNH